MLFFKIADAADEFEQIHRLNYRAFVEEIPQHPPNPERRLVDRFHDENTYVVGCDGGRVAAMLALRGRRPFSLDAKLPDLDAYLLPGRSVCEIRLLYVEPTYRARPAVFRGLLEAAADSAAPRGWNLAVISGTLRQQRLYRHLGFVPFGPVVGRAGAQFQPMYWTLETARTRLPWLESLQPS